MSCSEWSKWPAEKISLQSSFIFKLGPYNFYRHLLLLSVADWKVEDWTRSLTSMKEGGWYQNNKKYTKQLGSVNNKICFTWTWIRYSRFRIFFQEFCHENCDYYGTSPVVSVSGHLQFPHSITLGSETFSHFEIDFIWNFFYFYCPWKLSNVCAVPGGKCESVRKVIKWKIWVVHQPLIVRKSFFFMFFFLVSVCADSGEWMIDEWFSYFIYLWVERVSWKTGRIPARWLGAPWVWSLEKL